MTTNESEVKSYLDANPDFLEDYVLRNISQDTIEKWTIRKAAEYNKCKIFHSIWKSLPAGFVNFDAFSAALDRTSDQSKWRFCVHADKRALLRELASGNCLPPAFTYPAIYLLHVLSLSLRISLPLLHPKHFNHNSILKLHYGMDFQKKRGYERGYERGSAQ